MSLEFRRASKEAAKLRLALIGPSGSGKTYTGLLLATNLGERVAVIDTERGSASKYADRFSFDALDLETFSPETYVAAIQLAEKVGYDVLLIDSLSHAWMGKDGALEQVDKAKARSRSKNSFTAWRDVTPKHNALVDAIVRADLHVVATMRAKTEYVVEEDGKGKTAPRKIGLAPVQRDGLEYEFDVVADMDFGNTLIVSKTRCPDLAGAVIAKPGPELAQTLRAWLTDGSAPAERPAVLEGGASRSSEPPAADTPETSEDSAETISREDWKLLVAHAKESGLGPDDLKSLTGGRTGGEIRKSELSGLLDAIRGWEHGE